MESFISALGCALTAHPPRAYRRFKALHLDSAEVIILE
jgi:hypothetical protein